MFTPLAELPYLRIDPVLVRFNDSLAVRWYGLSYVFAFALAYLVLKGVARRGRWPVATVKVADVLFWGILGVFVGGRLGYVLFYMIPAGEFSWAQVPKTCDGGMSFHGGLAGVIIAYLIWCRVTGKRIGDTFDGLTLATPLGILCVRLANYVNAELYGRVTTSALGMRFPKYGPGADVAAWEAAGRPMTEPRYPSQLFEAFGEGLLLYVVLRWLMLGKGIGGGRIAGFFLIGYGVIRFGIEFLREPDANLGFVAFGSITRGQQLCVAMVLAGLFVLWRCRAKGSRPGRYDPESGEPVGSAADSEDAPATEMA